MALLQVYKPQTLSISPSDFVDGVLTVDSTKIVVAVQYQNTTIHPEINYNDQDNPTQFTINMYSDPTSNIRITLV